MHERSQTWLQSKSTLRNISLKKSFGHGPNYLLEYFGVTWWSLVKHYVLVISTVRCSYNRCIQRSNPIHPNPHIALSVQCIVKVLQEYCKGIVRVL